MIFDLHNDFPTKFLGSDYAPIIGSFNGNTVTAVIWTSELDGDVVSTVRAVKEKIDSARGKEIPCALEDVGFFAKDEQFERFEFGEYLYCSLTWNFNNGFAGGALDNGELTPLGKRIVSAINKSGCAVDLAHLNKKSFYSVLGYAEKPICSHTGFNSHLRSLDDGMIRALIQKNAVIGLCTVPAFTDAHNAKEFADIIDRFVQRYGDRNLALGTDFNGSDDIPSDIADYDSLARVSDILEAKGYSTRSIDNIFFQNANTFYRKEQS